MLGPGDEVAGVVLRRALAHLSGRRLFAVDGGLAVVTSEPLVAVHGPGLLQASREVAGDMESVRVYRGALHLLGTAPAPWDGPTLLAVADGLWRILRDLDGIDTVELGQVVHDGDELCLVDVGAGSLRGPEVFRTLMADLRQYWDGLDEAVRRRLDQAARGDPVDGSHPVPSRPEPVLWVPFGAATDSGPARAINEDLWQVELRRDLVRAAVIDGQCAFSGAVEGVRRVASWLREDLAIDLALRHANRALHGDPVLREGSVGAVVVAADVVRRDGRWSAIVGWVGDARLYRLRRGRLDRLTDDHTLVEHMVATGQLAPEDAVDHPHAAILLRAIGALAEPEDLVEVRPVEVESGDRLVLCTDGVWRSVRDAGLLDVCAAQTDPRAVARALVEAAWTEGTDNVAVVVLDIPSS